MYLHSFFFTNISHLSSAFLTNNRSILTFPEFLVCSILVAVVNSMDKFIVTTKQTKERQNSSPWPDRHCKSMCICLGHLNRQCHSKSHHKSSVLTTQVYYLTFLRSETSMGGTRLQSSRQSSPLLHMVSV